MMTISKYQCYLAACDQEIIDVYNRLLCEKNGIKLLLRDKETVARGFQDQNVTFKHYKTIPTKYIMSINPCLPFLTMETCINGIEKFLNNPQWLTMSSGRKRCNIFFDENLKIINKSNYVATTHQPPIYEMAHAFHIFDKEYFMNNSKFWDYSEFNPYIYEIPESEILDIDEPIEFFICSKIYEKFGPVLSGQNYLL